MKKEFMKRVMAAGMVAAMALTTVACGGSADNSASTDKAEAPAEDAAPATEAAAAEDDGSGGVVIQDIQLHRQQLTHL